MLISYISRIREQETIDKNTEIEVAREIRSLTNARDRFQTDDGIPNKQALDERIKELKHRLIRANLNVVVSIARRYNLGMVPLADLIQEGNLALMDAVDRFDPDMGFQFNTFASSLIRNAIRDALAKHGNVVRLPSRVISDRVRLQSSIHKFEVKNGCSPNDEQLAEMMQISLTQLRRIQNRSFIRVESKRRRDSDGISGDYPLLLADENNRHPGESIILETWLRKKDQVLGVLTPVEKSIIHQRFGLDDGDEMTLNQIGNSCNLSKERIRQIQNGALEKLRSAFAEVH